MEYQAYTAACIRLNFMGAQMNTLSLNSILFATDFSVASMQALPYATSIASVRFQIVYSPCCASRGLSHRTELL